MNIDNGLRVRFAPSPTGYLHIGGARTALFNWLWARQHGGSFILRVEDTDEERSTPESTHAILAGLKWLGMDWDEGPHPDPAHFGESIGPHGPYYQSERAPRHKEVIEQMLASGNAFYCPASAEEMTEVGSDGKERKRMFSPYRELSREEQQAALEKAGGALPVRIKCPPDLELRWDDTVRGEVSVSSNELGDFIIQKSSGQLLYNFAVTCDDIDMKVTHVLRGEDHLSNTPKQLLIYRAMGWQPPVFGHVPLIVGSDRAKLSKRHGATAVDLYMNDGTLPEALTNFLVLIGWAPKDNREFFLPEGHSGPVDMALVLEELKGVFNPADIGKSAGMFNVEKLAHFNGLYIRALQPAEFFERLKPFLPAGWLELKGEDYCRRVCVLYQDKLSKLNEIEANAWYFFRSPQAGYRPAYGRQSHEAMPEDASYSSHRIAGGRFEFRPEDYNEKNVNKHLLQNGEAPRVICQLYERLLELEESDWTSQQLEPLVDRFCEETELGKGKVMQPWRVALTGDQISPGFFDLLEVLGREETLARALPWVEYLKADAELVPPGAE